MDFFESIAVVAVTASGACCIALYLAGLFRDWVINREAKQQAHDAYNHDIRWTNRKGR
jgi:hypothetical protein